MKTTTLILKIFEISVFVLVMTPIISLGENHNYYAIKGGVSLGSYESGVNWVVIDNLKNTIKNFENKGKSERAFSFSGASAGALNALISVIEYLRIEGTPKDTPNYILNNILKNAWNIDIEQLLPKENNIETKNNEDGLFLIAPIKAKIEEIRKVVESPLSKFKNNELVYLTFSVTKFIADNLKLDETGTTIKQQRYIVFLEVSGEEDKLVFRNVRIDNCKEGITKDICPILIKLPENNGKVSFSDVANAALTSGSFPVAFSPRKLKYCNMTSKSCDEKEDVENIKEDLFCDGGLFDNSPVGIAATIKQLFISNNEGSEHTIIYISPDSIRSDRIIQRDKKVSPPELVGLLDYSKYLQKAFDVSTSQLYFSALQDIGNKKIDYKSSSRAFPLTGDYHAHFSAFYSADFMLHDYLVGVYDGIIFILKDEVKKDSKLDGFTHKEIDDLEKMFDTSIDLLNGNDSNINDRRAYEFLNYLFDKEFRKSTSFRDSYKENGMIVISEALQKCTAEKNKYSECTFDEFIRNLREFKNGIFKEIAFDKSTTKLVGDYPIWKKEHIEPLLTRLVNNEILSVENIENKRLDNNEMLSAENIKNQDDYDLRNGIKTGLIVLKPFVESALEHQDTNIWPLSSRVGAFPYSLQIGFDVRESATLFSLKPVRINLGNNLEKLIGNPLTFDFFSTFHYLSSDRANDHYFSFGGGTTIHFNSFVFPTFEFGYEYSLPGQSYTDSLQSLYVYLGVLGELFRIGCANRLQDVDTIEVHEHPRSQIQLMLLIDLTKIAPALASYF